MENYEVIDTIGKGSFGTVCRIRRKSDGKLLVWKELSYGHMSEKEKQLVVTEVNVLRELRHPFVVRYYDRIIDKQTAKLYIIMEYCEGGDLGRLIKHHRRAGTQVEESEIWRYFAQIVLALKDCHRRQEKGCVRPIIHRDIKPGNIMLDRRNNVKVGDFGLSKELASRSKYAYTNVGTPFYMSPEMVNELRYNERSDIWAVGCLLYELAALRPPFEAHNQLSLAMKINSGKFPSLPSRYSEDLYRAIRWMLHTQQSKRPSVDELERLPPLQAHLAACTPIVRAYTCRGSSGSAEDGGAARDKEAQREENLRKRETAVELKERELRERETRLEERERQVQRREAAVAAARPTAFGGARPGTGVPPPVPGGAAPGPGKENYGLGGYRARKRAGEAAPGAFHVGMGARPGLQRGWSADDVTAGNVNGAR